MPDAKERLEKLGGIANNTANFYYSVMDSKDVNRNVIIQMYANIKRMSCLIEEFLLLYDIEDNYQEFKKLTDIDSKVKYIGKNRKYDKSNSYAPDKSYQDLGRCKAGISTPSRNAKYEFHA